MNHFSKSKQKAGGPTTTSIGSVDPTATNAFPKKSSVIRTELPLDLDSRADLQYSAGQFKGGFWRKQLLSRLDRLDQASVNLVELHGNQAWTKQVGVSADAELRASVVVNDQTFFKRILWSIWVFSGSVRIHHPKPCWSY